MDRDELRCSVNVARCLQAAREIADAAGKLEVTTTSLFLGMMLLPGSMLQMRVYQLFGAVGAACLKEAAIQNVGSELATRLCSEEYGWENVQELGGDNPTE